MQLMLPAKVYVQTRGPHGSWPLFLSLPPVKSEFQGELSNREEQLLLLLICLSAGAFQIILVRKCNSAAWEVYYIY
jgi:hypothetical protein